MRNEEAVRRDHIENSCLLCRNAGWQYHEIDWKFQGLASCWSEVKCLLCDVALPGAPVTSPSRDASGEEAPEVPDDEVLIAAVVPPPPEVTPDVRSMWELRDSAAAALPAASAAASAELYARIEEFKEMADHNPLSESEINRSKADRAD